MTGKVDWFRNGSRTPNSLSLSFSFSFFHLPPYCPLLVMGINVARAWGTSRTGSLRKLFHFTQSVSLEIASSLARVDSRECRNPEGRMLLSSDLYTTPLHTSAVPATSIIIKKKGRKKEGISLPRSMSSQHVSMNCFIGFSFFPLSLTLFLSSHQYQSFLKRMYSSFSSLEIILLNNFYPHRSGNLNFLTWETTIILTLLKLHY